MSEVPDEAVREVEIRNPSGLHARPVMGFIDIASKYRSTIWVTNLSRRGERVDGKSAMDMMLLEATPGSVLRIEAQGDDAREAVEALALLLEAGSSLGSPPSTD